MNAYILNQKEKETIEQNIKLAYWKAHKWAKVLQNHAILDELISCCEMGLISAVHTCDYSRSNKLATYANVCMDNQVKMYLRGSTSKAIPFSSLTYMDNDGSEYSEIENIADPNESPDDIVEKQELLRQLERLPNKEFDIIFMYYYGGFTEYEIAIIMAYSQSYVSRLIKKSLKRLHDIIFYSS